MHKDETALLTEDWLLETSIGAVLGLGSSSASMGKACSSFEAAFSALDAGGGEVGEVASEPANRASRFRRI